jgi:hypothetical protein
VRVNGEREINALIAELRTVYGDAADQLRATLDSPNLTASGGARAGKLIRQVEAMRAALDAKAAQLTANGISKAYRYGANLASQQLTDMGVNATLDLGSVIHASAVQVIAEQMATDLLNANGIIETQIKGVIRKTQQAVIEERAINRTLGTALIQGQTRREATDAIVAQIQAGLGNDQFLVINGRRYKPAYYAELVARTRTTEAVTQGAINTAIENGFDLVQITVHNHPQDDPCSPHQGRIYSLSGKSKTFPKLTARPPFHPNCRHRIVPVSEEHLERLGQLDAAKALAKSDTTIADQAAFEAFRTKTAAKKITKKTGE